MGTPSKIFLTEYNVMVRRDALGRVVKGGGCLNPGGRPKDEHGIAKLARSYAPEAIEALVDLVRNGEPAVRVRAAQALLDRGFGRPAQSLEGRLEVSQGLPAMHIEAVRHLASVPRLLPVPDLKLTDESDS